MALANWPPTVYDRIHIRVFLDACLYPHKGLLTFKSLRLRNVICGHTIQSEVMVNKRSIPAASSIPQHDDKKKYQGVWPSGAAIYGLQ